MVEYTILLDGLTVEMGLGIHAAERAAAQRVTIDVAMTCRYPALPEDRIHAVVDYDFLRQGVLALVASRHFELQEVLCEEIARLAFADPRVVHARVRSRKLDVYGDSTIGCEIERSRP